jgi:hypothetical protein
MQLTLTHNVLYGTHIEVPIPDIARSRESLAARSINSAGLPSLLLRLLLSSTTGHGSGARNTREQPSLISGLMPARRRWS